MKQQAELADSHVPWQLHAGSAREIVIDLCRVRNSQPQVKGHRNLVPQVLVGSEPAAILAAWKKAM